MSHTVIIGNGEVGSALNEVLSPAYQVYLKDLDDKDIPEKPLTLHICLNYATLGRDKWFEISRGYIKHFKPRLIDVCSTVPPGTTKELRGDACHSTTRGLHPNLAEGLKSIAKHIGGPAAPHLDRFYRGAGIKCVTHRKAVTTEVAHLAHLVDYGIQIMSADLRNRICRQFNVDYLEAVTRYTETHNAGFSAMDMPSKLRMNLTPPGGRIGGHCVTAAAGLIRETGFDHALLQRLENYNNGISGTGG